MRTLLCNRKWAVLRHTVEGHFPRRFLSSCHLSASMLPFSLPSEQKLSSIKHYAPLSRWLTLYRMSFNRSCERHVIPSDGHPSPSTTTFGPLCDAPTQWVNFDKYMIGIFLWVLNLFLCWAFHRSKEDKVIDTWPKEVLKYHILVSFPPVCPLPRYQT